MEMTCFGIVFSIIVPVSCVFGCWRTLNILSVVNLSMSLVSIELARFAVYQNDYANQVNIGLSYVESGWILSSFDLKSVRVSHRPQKFTFGRKRWRWLKRFSTVERFLSSLWSENKEDGLVVYRLAPALMKFRVIWATFSLDAVRSHCPLPSVDHFEMESEINYFLRSIPVDLRWS